MEHPSIYEGTAQEIAEQLRHSASVGRLKAIVVPDTHPVQDGNAPNQAHRLADFLAEVDQIEFIPGKPHCDIQEQEVSRLIAAKFAGQGHNK